ncbi:MAG: LytTR family DNA-binding domain-containing protein [Bacteroidetes bacterium]|nr:LytTR family DNA-binding domain-containing protein [Bacteroidota bacterium]
MSHKLKCLIVDDEPLAQRIIEKYAEDVPTIEIIGKCKNAFEALQLLNDNHVDLLFLDINMPKLSGINFLKTLKNPPLTIFTTAYSEYALEGYELDVIDYLKKPFSFERFLKAVQKAQERVKEGSKETIVHEVVSAHNNEEGFIFVKSNKKTFKVNISDVFYIEALGDYVKIHTNDKVIVTYQSMKKIEALLPAANFTRIHKSYIVAISKIKSIEGNMVEIKDEKLPIGSNYKQEFQSIIDKSSVS